jgi:FtsP/CotA-like multicopper oxidase with cupredoxin domain
MSRSGVLLLAAAALLAAYSPGPVPDRMPERVVANQNRTPAGRLRNGVLSLDLEVRWARWWPESEHGPSRPVQAFAEAGGEPLIPGPLIRVPVGTEIRATIHNALKDSTVILYGLRVRPGSPNDTLQIAPGATRRAHLRADRAGTYFYWGTSTHSTIDERPWLDSQLAGGFIIDPPDTKRSDRVFVLGVWEREGDSSAAGSPDTGGVMVINGKAWPHTERFSFTAGDSVDWRWINPSGSSHPMHLHGFYFEVESRGDWTRDTIYSPRLRPLEVTELILPGGTARLRWQAARAGNWIFHCHFAVHISTVSSLEPVEGMGAGPEGLGHGPHRMAGLVLGIQVRPRPGSTPVAGSDHVNRARPAPRRLRLLVQASPGRFGRNPGMGYVLQEGSVEPAPDSIQIPGAPLILQRGAPVSVTVVNHLGEPTAVHWHGIELESYADGVPGWSGAGSHLAPVIEPGDSFTARFTPPRAGTFIYHTHLVETRQMGLGLYGPLIVVEPGSHFVADTERIVVVGLAGPSDAADTLTGLINGRLVPQPLEITAGRPYRFRLINIDADHRILFSLMSGDSIGTWRPAAKDGADLPAAQRTERPARLLTGPGETADFDVSAAHPGELELEIAAPYTNRPWKTALPIHVTAQPNR